MPDAPLTASSQLPRPDLKSRLAWRWLALQTFLTREEAIQRALARPRIHILCLHHVFTDQLGKLAALCDALAVTGRFVPLSAACDALLTSFPIAPLLAITFDDGLRMQLAAAEMLRDRGIRACFFLCPAALDCATPEAGRVFCRDRLRAPWVELMHWRDAERLLALGHEIGCHSLSHADLARAQPDALHEQIALARDRLSAAFGPIRHFAWPFGRFATFSAPAARAVYNAGFDTCISAERGCHIAAASSPRPLIRRDSLDLSLPLPQLRCLLARSSNRATAAMNDWPSAWAGPIHAGAPPCA